MEKGVLRRTRRVAGCVHTTLPQCWERRTVTTSPGNVFPSAFLGMECHPREYKVLGLRTVNRWFTTSHSTPPLCLQVQRLP